MFGYILSLSRQVSTVQEGLHQHYTKTLRPFEEAHLFHSLHSAPLEEAEFFCKPSVLLVGQYSTGKTTFIRCSHIKSLIIDYVIRSRL